MRFTFFFFFLLFVFNYVVAQKFIYSKERAPIWRLVRGYKQKTSAAVKVTCGKFGRMNALPDIQIQYGET